MGRSGSCWPAVVVACALLQCCRPRALIAPLLGVDLPPCAGVGGVSGAYKSGLSCLERLSWCRACLCCALCLGRTLKATFGSAVGALNALHTHLHLPCSLVDDQEVPCGGSGAARACFMKPPTAREFGSITGRRQRPSDSGCKLCGSW
jgi:hypothetical protein